MANMWPAIWKFVASSQGLWHWQVGQKTCYILEWFTSKRWSLTRKNIKGEPKFARSTPTKTICTKHQTSSRPCIKPESTDGWKMLEMQDARRLKSGLLSEFCGKKNIVMPSKWRGFDPPHRPEFWFLHWLVLVWLKIIPNSAMLQDTNPYTCIHYKN